MKIRHEHNGKFLEGDASGLGGGMFLLTNKKGGFLSLCPDGNITTYNGLIHWDATLKTHCKSIENLSLGIGAPITIINRIHEVERRYVNGASEHLRLSSSAVHYALRKHRGGLLLDLDMRRLDDHDPRGRIYAARQEGERLIITYTKHHDDTLATRAYEQVLIIDGLPEGAFTPLGEWQERRYAYDERRGEQSSGWVYRAGRIAVDGDLDLVIARSVIEEKAIQKAAYAREHGEKILQSQETYARNAYKQPRPETNLSLAAFDSLVTRFKGGQTGIIAGLPWFARFWSRDELISLSPLIMTEQYGLAKEILLRYYELLEEPLLPAYYPHGGNIAADSLGWLADRTRLLLLALERKGSLDEYFTRIELAYLHDRMGNAIKALERERGCPTTNGPGETWMDTVVDGEGRDGARVEIQALNHACYDLLAFLDQRTRRLPVNVLPRHPWKRRGKECAKRFKERFLKEGILVDGLVDDQPDLTPRPNLFLACYLAPSLLSKKEWIVAFDQALEHLWLPWGGLASIGRHSKRFHGRYSGADDRSYHLGDSWYWVNALAAIVLRRLDAKRYADHIQRLTEACLRDLLWHGALGHVAELSSADNEEWGGTFAQAWSAALLFELLAEEGK